VSKICSHVDFETEEDVIMKYSITDASLKTEMERLVSSLEDRKVTLIQQLKLQDISVSEAQREESKEYPGNLMNNF
jgi:hypothetical protein